jgi:hypothetical protein
VVAAEATRDAALASLGSPAPLSEPGFTGDSARVPDGPGDTASTGPARTPDIRRQQPIMNNRRRRNGDEHQQQETGK